MFSLILTLITIVIVTALALATIYYGGAAFRQGADEAKAATAVNEGQQIRGALDLYQASQGVLPVGTSDDIKNALISSHYLASFPATVAWGFVDDYAVATNLTAAQCTAYNKKLKVESIPKCSDMSATTASVCCEE